MKQITKITLPVKPFQLEPDLHVLMRMLKEEPATSVQPVSLRSLITDKVLIVEGLTKYKYDITED